MPVRCTERTVPPEDRAKENDTQMRSMESNNPVFSRSEPLARSLSQGVGFHPAPSADEVENLYRTPQRMTMDDVVVKTGILLAIVVGVGAASWYLQVGIGIAMIAALVGFALAMVNIFKKQVSPPLIMAYAVAQGVFLGVISASYEGTYRGIVVQAIVGTAAVFAAVLFGYKSGRLRATPKFTKVVTFGLVGMVAVLMLNLLVGAFTTGDPLGISGGNTGLSILFTLGLITFGALTFVLDFDQADRMVAAGVAEEESWRVAFGLVVGLIFLYLNILRLLAYLQSSD
ncbi:Bax inhibitor-1/YccA family protein [soil metagenome]